jgi:ABC-2 type transport system permease protein
MSLRHIWTVTLKELRHIWRDRTTFFLFAFTPALLLFILAYALTADIQHVPIALLDQDRSPTSRAYIQQVTVGEDLDLYAQVSSLSEIEDLLRHGRVKAAIVLPPTFEHDLLSLRGVSMQVLVDGTEPQSGGFAVDHIRRRSDDFTAKLLVNQLRARGISVETLYPLDLRIRTWYNPNLKASVDLVPGLISIVLAVPGLSVALTLARERERGTLEQLLVTPIRRAELLLGKMAPYVISGIFNVVLTTGLARAVFRIPFNGDFGLYLLLSLVFFFAVLSMGMIIGVFLRTQAAALALSFLVLFFPGFFMSGIFFPLTSMPPLVRMEAMGLPGTHFVVIIRGLFITGVGLDVLWPYGLVLLIMGVVFTGIAALFFKKKLQ